LSQLETRRLQKRLPGVLVAVICLAALAAVILAAGCQPKTRVTPTTLPAPGPTAAPATPPANGDQPVDGDSGAVNLRVWLPPDIASASVREQGRAQLFVNLVAERARPGHDVVLDASTKALRGPGGLRESILATAPVAPSRLPHLALVDSTDLPALVAAGLAQPLASADTLSFSDNLAPLALEAVTLDGICYGVPLGVDLLVMGYDAAEVSAPPASWAELLTGSEPLLFSAARGADAADVLLAQYLSEGGVVAASEPVIDTAALSRALAAYQVGKAASAIHDRAASTDSFELAWAEYLAGQANLAVVTSLQVLRDGASAPHTALAALPVSGPKTVVLGRVLVWVVLTPDPEAQDVALAVAVASLDAELQRLLTESSYHLPVSTAALEEPSLDPWREQLTGLYALAIPLPAIAQYAAVEAALAEAAESVLTGSANPAAAAGLAAARIAQSQ
jgi:maltose-binding protein MalE